MAEKSSSKGAVIVAIIGVVGTISAALIANWDKLWGNRSVDQPRLEQATSGKTESQPANQVAKVGGGTQDVGMDAAAPINIAGKWTDAAGYEYVYEQSGNDYTFVQFKDGNEVNRGYGSLHGRNFEGYFSGNFGQGSCKGELSADINQADSVCTIGDRSFTLKETRSAAAKS